MSPKRRSDMIESGESTKVKVFLKKTSLMVKYGNDIFRTSRGWISNFIKRHGLCALKLCDEKLSYDKSFDDPFLHFQKR